MRPWTFQRGHGFPQARGWPLLVAADTEDVGLPTSAASAETCSTSTSLSTQALTNRYADKQIGENVITNVAADASFYEVGSATPDWMGGMTLNFRYKSFDISIVGAYQIGGKIFSREYGTYLYAGSTMGRTNIPMSKELIGKTWTPEHSGAYFPSYFRLKNITIGYTFPKSITRKVNIDALRVFASADNVLLFSQAQGVDPTLSIIGGKEIDTYVYPQMQTFTFGINLDF